MSRPVKVLTICLWIVAVAGMVGVVALQLWTRDHQTARADIGPDPAPISQLRDYGIRAPSFTLTDQLGHSFSSDQLKGHPWVTDFIFTECASTCPLMTARLSALQKSIPPEVAFVSFSVDPEHDTPAVLLDYAKANGADNQRWHFLTGEKAQVMDVVRGMKSSIIPASGTNPIEHDVHFMLFDGDGRLWGLYDSTDASQVAKISADARKLLARQGRKP